MCHGASSAPTSPSSTTPASSPGGSGRSRRLSRSATAPEATALPASISTTWSASRATSAIAWLT